MNRQDMCKCIQRHYGRVPESLMTVLLDAWEKGHKAHYDSLRTQFSYETESAGFDVHREFMSKLKHGVTPARKIIEQPTPKNVVPIREQIQPWGPDSPGAA